MKPIKDKEEILEELWYLKEKQCSSLDKLKEAAGDRLDAAMLDDLKRDGLVNIDTQESTITFTEEGETYARQIIRAHRLGERLVCDVLQNSDFEAGACEFEHTLNPELVDSICTLLGHPAECPHGRPIPQGECCKRSTRTARTSVVPLTELEIGRSARIAYVQCRNDQQMHRIDGLQIRPGVVVKLHQKYPTFVVECEGMSIALDKDVAENIRVWAQEVTFTPPAGMEQEKGLFRGFGFRRRRRGR